MAGSGPTSTGATFTDYIYDAWGNLQAEYTSSTPPTSGCNTPTCYVSVDQIGSTRMVTDSNGNVTSRYDYLPFGEEIVVNVGPRTTTLGYQGSPDGFNPKFTGQMRDTENLLDYFNARYYSPAQGRFVNPDPENAGADPTNPQTWNGYSYVNNNPPAHTDPSGRGFWSDLGDILGTLFGSLGINETSIPTGIPGGGDTLPDNSAPWSEQIPVSGVPGGTLDTGDVFGSGNTGGVIFSELPGVGPDGRPDTAYTINGLTFFAEGLAFLKDLGQGKRRRPEWLNNVTSVFGYDQNLPGIPSCFGIAMGSAKSHANPFTPDVSSTGEALGTYYTLSKYNQAIQYAASTPSRTFGTQFLLYPNKSNVFRSLLKQSGRGVGAGILGALDISLMEGLYDEYTAMKRGECQ